MWKQKEKQNVTLKRTKNQSAQAGPVQSKLFFHYLYFLLCKCVFPFIFYLFVGISKHDVSPHVVLEISSEIVVATLCSCGLTLVVG